MSAITDLALGGDVDNATLRRLAADGKIADLVWEAPEELAAEHGQAFQSAMQAYHTGAFRAGRAALAGVADDLVARLGSELRGARAAAERGDHDVLAGQTAALGHRLLRAPLRPPRPPAPAYPQHRPHPAHDGDSSRRAGAIRTASRLPAVVTVCKQRNHCRHAYRRLCLYHRLRRWTMHPRAERPVLSCAIGASRSHRGYLESAFPALDVHA